MYVSNMKYFGHLVDTDNFETTHLHNELYELFNNPQVLFYIKTLYFGQLRLIQIILRQPTSNISETLVPMKTKLHLI